MIYALDKTRSLTGGLNKTNAQILDELKRKLAIKEAYDIRKKIDEILEETKEQNVINPIKVGMMISEVEKIMGSPTEVVTNGSEGKSQLWIYQYPDKKELYLTFTNYKLFRIEEK